MYSLCLVLFYFHNSKLGVSILFNNVILEPKLFRVGGWINADERIISGPTPILPSASAFRETSYNSYCIFDRGNSFFIVSTLVSISVETFTQIEYAFEFIALSKIRLYYVC